MLAPLVERQTADALDSKLANVAGRADELLALAVDAGPRDAIDDDLEAVDAPLAADELYLDRAFVAVDRDGVEAHAPRNLLEPQLDYRLAVEDDACNGHAAERERLIRPSELQPRLLLRPAGLLVEWGATPNRQDSRQANEVAHPISPPSSREAHRFVRT